MLKKGSDLTRKRELLVWAIVFVIMLTSVVWSGCGTVEPNTNLAPPESPRPSRGEGFMPRASGVLTILSATEVESIDIALQQAVDEERVTKEQADEIRDWWQQRPKILSADVFPRQMRER